LYCISAGNKKKYSLHFLLHILYCSLVCAFLLNMVRQIQNTLIPNLQHSTNLSITWLSMPCTVLVRLPGGATGRLPVGATGRVCMWYAVRQKLQLLEECNRLRRVENPSLRGAAAAINIPHTVLVRWTKARPRLTASLGTRQKAICKGPVGQLDSIREELLQWIFARHEQGNAVMMPHIVYKSSSILRHQQEAAFKDKSFEARLKAVTHFLAKYNFVYRMKTNLATRSPVEVYKEVTVFMSRNCLSCCGPHRNKQ
jgi:hypothetical protein